MAERHTVKTIIFSVVIPTITSIFANLVTNRIAHITLSWPARFSIFLGTLCIVLLCYYILARSKLKKLEQAQGKETFILYDNRTDAPADLLDAQIGSAKQSIYIVGITNESILSSNAYRFTPFLDKGGVLNVLLQTDPDLLEEMIVLQYGKDYQPSRLSKAMRDVLSALDIIINFEETHPHQVHCRALSSAFSTSCVASDILDPSNARPFNGADGAILAALYQYGHPTEDCPVFQLKRGDGHDKLFLLLQDSIRRLWNDGTEITPDDIETIRTNLEQGIAKHLGSKASV